MKQLPPDSPPPIGQILARKRSERGLSLQSLARVSGVSKSMISQVENGQVNPTLAVVWKLANGLGVSLQDILQGEARSPVTEFLYLGEHNCPTLISNDLNYRIQILSTVDMVEKVELYLIEFGPGGRMDSEAHSKGTVETLTALRGEVDVVLNDGEPRRVKTLQSVRYRADVGHTIRNVSKTKALFYLAVKFEKT